MYGCCYCCWFFFYFLCSSHSLHSFIGVVVSSTAAFDTRHLVGRPLALVSCLPCTIARYNSVCTLPFDGDPYAFQSAPTPCARVPYCDLFSTAESKVFDDRVAAFTYSYTLPISLNENEFSMRLVCNFPSECLGSFSFWGKLEWRTDDFLVLEIFSGYQPIRDLSLNK